MAFWKWSRTASSNATADSTINWAEGMAPSAVNDSARAMMARIAEWRDDVSGTITTAGTPTAYTLSSNQGFDNLADMSGAMVAFVTHTTNGATVTLNVDGLGGKPLRFGPSLELQSGVLIQGTPYVVSYNNSDGAFYLQGGFANPYGIPLGGMMPYIGSSTPSSAFAFPDAQAISRTTYATLSRWWARPTARAMARPPSTCLISADAPCSIAMRVVRIASLSAAATSMARRWAIPVAARIRR
jgi:hypothetical protein